MIEMFCDRCSERIERMTNGAARLRTGKRELSFHLCELHQEELRRFVIDFCNGNARDVQPSLKGG